MNFFHCSSNIGDPVHFTLTGLMILWSWFHLTCPKIDATTGSHRIRLEITGTFNYPYFLPYPVDGKVWIKVCHCSPICKNLCHQKYIISDSSLIRFFCICFSAELDWKSAPDVGTDLVGELCADDGVDLDFPANFIGKMFDLTCCGIAEIGELICGWDLLAYKFG